MNKLVRKNMGIRQMTFAIKTTTQVQAWELGAGSEKEKEMSRDGKIIAHSDGLLRFSQRKQQEPKAK